MTLEDISTTRVQRSKNVTLSVRATNGKESVFPIRGIYVHDEGDTVRYDALGLNVGDEFQVLDTFFGDQSVPDNGVDATVLANSTYWLGHARRSLEEARMNYVHYKETLAKEEREKATKKSRISNVVAAHLINIYAKLCATFPETKGTFSVDSDKVHLQFGDILTINFAKGNNTLLVMSSHSESGTETIDTDGHTSPYQYSKNLASLKNYLDDVDMRKNGM